MPYFSVVACLGSITFSFLLQCRQENILQVSFSEAICLMILYSLPPDIHVHSARLTMDSVITAILWRILLLFKVYHLVYYTGGMLYAFELGSTQISHEQDSVLHWCLPYLWTVPWSTDK